MAVNLLQDWCKGVDLDPRKALLIVGIPTECSEEEIRETIKANLEPLCSYTVLGQIFRKEDNAKAVFVQLTEPVNYAVMPTHILGRGGIWEVVVKPRRADNEFLSRLNSFLKDEGRRLVDVAQILEFSTSRATEGRKPQVQEPGVVGPAAAPSLPPPKEGMWYRKLKVFSGNASPVPGEEPFDLWLEQATEMMQLWQVSEVEKRRRLLESLRGPALSILCVLRANSNVVTVQQSLEALKLIFGTKEDSRTSQLHLRQAFQESGEKLSAFLIRLEPLLQKAVQHSTTCVHGADTMRLKHVLAKATLPPSLRGKLDILNEHNCAPTFLELMKLVRDEEEWETTMLVTKRKSGQVRDGQGGSTRQVAVEVHVPPPQAHLMPAGPSMDRSTQTGQEEASPSEKRRRLSCCCASEDLSQVIKVESESPDDGVQSGAVEESGNGGGAGAVSHPKP
ncbi:paraneoplastic antigen-like protein 5 [Orycteropus afer afer]|uniref:Paraneoplastic antigen-like protein 5 n=1 Tax=Orycteropus afer afer TaxID=1230840 RepID=A0A8B7BDW1_ORYAF|nr:paraneoplastic antigen-like protein 5 [Orycteropus afer afer]